MTKVKRVGAVVLACAIVAAFVTAERQGFAEQSAASEWRTYGGDKGFTRYSALDRITRENVAIFGRSGGGLRSTLN